MFDIETYVHVHVYVRYLCRVYYYFLDVFAVDVMFTAMSDCQTLHPDPEDSPDSEEEEGTVKFLNFGTPKNFAVIYLKFKQSSQP